MIRIFIEGKEIDIKDNIVMDLNYSIADIMNVDKRNTQFSKTIEIPNSVTNSQVFGYIFDINVQNPYTESLPNVGLNFNPTKKAKATIYKDNISVFVGICRLICVNILDGEITYEINLFGTLKDILLELGDTYIHELDWEGDADQTNFPDQVWQFNPANFQVLYNDTTGSGTTSGLLPYKLEFCLPMVDYGITVNMAQWKWIDFKPAVYVRDVLKRMFRYANYVWDFSKFAPFFNTEYFKKLIIVNGEQGVGQWLKDLFRYNVVQEGYINNCPNAGQQPIYQFDFGCNCQVLTPQCRFINYAKFTMQYNNGALWTYGTATIPNTCASEVRNFYSYNGLVQQQFSVVVELRPRVKNVTFENQIGGQTSNFTNNRLNITHTVSIVRTNASDVVQQVLWTETKNLTTMLTGGVGTAVFNYFDHIVSYAGNVTMNPGDRIQIRVEGNSCYSPLLFGPLPVFIRTKHEVDWTWNDFAGFIKVDLPTISFVPISLNSIAKLSDQLPRNIKCVDLLKSIILMHNLYIEQDDNQNNLLYITPYPLYYDYDITKSADWSLQLDRGSQIKIIPLSELKAKRYKFGYTDDNDYWSESYLKRFNENYGEKTELVENDFLDTTEEVKLIFSPCVVASVDASNRNYISLYKLDGTTKKSDKFKPRIAMYKKVTTTPYEIMNETGTSVVFNFSQVGNVYNYAGHFDDPLNPQIDINFTLPKEIYFVSSSVTGNNLYETFWKSFIAEISDKDSRLVVGSFDLYSTDVDNIDFARLIKIDNQYYKLLKIEQFNPNGDTLTKVSLLKVLYDTNFGDLNFILQEDTNFLLQENGTNKFYI